MEDKALLQAETPSPALAPATEEFRHSEEIQQIIHRVPSWLLRWGAGLLLMLVLLLTGVSWMVKYPEIVRAPFRLTSIDKPKSLRARVDGKILRLFATEHQSVRKGQILAYIESAANPVEVITLSDILNKINEDPSILRNSDPMAGTDNFGDLGQVQTSFQAFMSTYQQYKASLNKGYYKQRMSLLQGQLNELLALQQNLEHQQGDYQRDYDISEQNYTASQKLASEKVIAPLELKQEESKVLAKQLPLREIRTHLYQNRNEQIDKQKEINELQKFIGDQRNAFLQALNLIRSEIDNWKLTYLLVAPFDGQVYFASFLQEHQGVTNGQELLYIAPSGGSRNEYGEILIPQDNSGRVRVGQRVMIKFMGYPFKEYGYVPGTISFISGIPTHDSSFLAKVELPKGLVTNFRKTLIYKEGMTATAEIVTDDSRLLQRFLHNFRELQ